MRLTYFCIFASRSFVDSMDTQKLRSHYPYIPLETLQILYETGAQEKQYESVNRKCQKATDEELRSYKLTQGSHDVPIGDKIPSNMTIQIIGSLGSGKSATANTILGSSKFAIGSSSVPVTHVPQSESTIYKEGIEFPITVIDTPGSWKMHKNGHGKIDVYVLVLNLASPRFDEKQLQKLKGLKDGSGKLIVGGRCVLLLTHARETLQEESLESYFDHIQNDPLYKLAVHVTKERVLAINNSNYKTEYEQLEQRRMIMNILLDTYGYQKMGRGRSGTKHCCVL